MNDANKILTPWHETKMALRIIQDNNGHVVSRASGKKFDEKETRDVAGVGRVRVTLRCKLKLKG